jgi:hypothetical protein
MCVCADDTVHSERKIDVPRHYFPHDIRKLGKNILHIFQINILEFCIKITHALHMECTRWVVNN